MDFISENAGIIGLLFFFTFFMGIALWTYRPGAKESYSKKGKIPLVEE